MDFKNIPKPYLEALGFFELYRRYGFPSAEIYALFAGQDGNVQICVQLRTQGKEVTAVAGFIPDTHESVEKTWIAVTGAVSDGTFPQSVLDKAWRKSMAYDQRSELALVLARKGIVLPQHKPN